MSPKAPSASSRRLFVVALLLGLFIFLDIGLFGWLLFRSLSKREIERVLLETREEAEGLAERLAGTAEEAGGDLYTVTAMEREVQTYIDSILKQRKFVRTVEVVDGEGRLVFLQVCCTTVRDCDLWRPGDDQRNEVGALYNPVQRLIHKWVFGPGR